MLRLIELGILIVVLVVVLRLIRGGRKRPRSPEILPPKNEHPDQKHDKPL